MVHLTKNHHEQPHAQMAQSPFNLGDREKCKLQLIKSVAFVQRHFPMTVCKFQLYQDNKRCDDASKCHSLHFPSPITPPDQLQQASTRSSISSSISSMGTLALSLDPLLGSSNNSISSGSNLDDLRIDLNVIAGPGDTNNDASSVGSVQYTPPLSPVRLKSHLSVPSSSPPTRPARIGAEISTPSPSSMRRTIHLPMAMSPLSKVMPVLIRIMNTEELKFGAEARRLRSRDEQEARNLMAGATLNLVKVLANDKGRAFNWDRMG